MDVQKTAENVVNTVTKNPDQREGTLTRAIEDQTSKVPSLGYFNLAVASMALSAGTALLSRRKSTANFFGLWAPCFLLIGLYNKVVKIERQLERGNYPK